MSIIYVTGDTHGQTDWEKLNMDQFPQQKSMTKVEQIQSIKYGVSQASVGGRRRFLHHVDREVDEKHIALYQNVDKIV